MVGVGGWVGGKGISGSLRYSPLLLPICDVMKENEKPRGRYLTKTMEIANDEI